MCSQWINDDKEIKAAKIETKSSFIKQIRIRLVQTLGITNDTITDNWHSFHQVWILKGKNSRDVTSYAKEFGSPVSKLMLQQFLARFLIYDFYQQPPNIRPFLSSFSSPFAFFSTFSIYLLALLLFADEKKLTKPLPVVAGHAQVQRHHHYRNSFCFYHTFPPRLLKAASHFAWKFVVATSFFVVMSDI